ncbi:MAG: hypothetical protein DWG76_02495 [Chloroflexi bacterium]|nr:hypothetical protein [Chloroflexota bacterium]
MPAFSITVWGMDSRISWTPIVWLVILMAGLSACGAILPKGAPGADLDGIEQETAIVVHTATPRFEMLLDSGLEAANRGDWAVALEFYTQAILMDGSQARSYLLRGNAQASLGNQAQAIADYDQVLAIDTSYTEAFNGRGLAKAGVGEASAAIADFDLAIALTPGYALAYRNRANVLIGQGNLNTAILDLRTYLELLPSAPDTQMIEAQIADLEAALTPQANEDGLLFADDFSDPASGWYSNGDPAAVAKYAEGGYLLGPTQANVAGWALQGLHFTDTRVEVDSMKVGGDEDNYFGVICRYQANSEGENFYVLLISSDGYYGVGKRVSDGALTLIGQDKMQFSNLINTGGAANHLRVECVGTQLRLTVNDVLLVETNDEALASGQIGLFAGTASETGTQILFNDLAVYAAGDQ